MPSLFSWISHAFRSLPGALKVVRRRASGGFITMIRKAYYAHDRYIVTASSKALLSGYPLRILTRQAIITRSGCIKSGKKDKEQMLNR